MALGSLELGEPRSRIAVRPNGVVRKGGVRRAEADDGALRVAAASGDALRFVGLYRRCLPLVNGCYFRRVRPCEVASDLTAEKFAALVDDLPRLDLDRGSAWLRV